MNGELTKLEIGDISKLIAAIYITDTDFRKILLKSVMGAFKTSHQNTNIQYGFGGTKPDQHAIDYLQERVFILSDKTTSKLEGDLRFELIAGLKNNESISEITKRLDTIFSDMMPYQLERIARTEIIDAQNGGRISAYKASGVVEYKMWIAAKGGKGKRVCALCARLNGQIQPLDKPFVDPETGESWQHPVAHPNGRCTTVPLTRLPDDIITAGGQLYAADKKLGKVEIPIDLLKSRQKRKAWVVRYANGYAVQCFEDEADADHFIKTSKEKDAGWFDFNNKVYREVKPGWVIHRKGAKITFETMSDDERKALDEKFLNEDKRVNKIEIDANTLNKKEIWIPQTAKRVGHWRKISTRKKDVKPPEEVAPKIGMVPENVKNISTLNELGMSGGMHDMDSYVVEFKDSQRAMYKTTERGAIIGETSTYDISKILNWDIIPETISGDFGKGEGSCQIWIENGVEPYEGFTDLKYKKVEENHFDDLSKIFIMDMITGNYDRHSGNVMIDGNDKCWAIDNEDWGTSGSADDFIHTLDERAGIHDISAHCPMIRWLDKNLDERQYLKFRENVIENIKSVVENKDKIIDYYNKYKNGDFTIGEDADEKSITLVILCIKDNLDYIEKYLGEHK